MCNRELYTSLSGFYLGSQQIIFKYLYSIGYMYLKWFTQFSQNVHTTKFLVYNQIDDKLWEWKMGIGVLLFFLN